MSARRRYKVGDTVKNWAIRDIAHTTRHPGGTTNRFYLAECTNCGHRMPKTPWNMRVGGCRNCYLMPKGRAGMNRMMDSYRRNARKARIPFTLKADEFLRLTSAPCFYCSAPPSQLTTCNAKDPSKKSTWGDYISNGLDRVVAGRGYTAGNCVPCCWFCNRARNSTPFEEFAAHWRTVHERFTHGEIPAACKL